MDLALNLISTFLGDRLIKMLKSGSDYISDELSQMVNNRVIEYLQTEYMCNYKTKTILHKAEPIELEKFYQPLCLRRKLLSSRHHSTCENSNRIGTKHLKYLFNNKNCITIIGTAGSGKSTLVKYLFVDCIKNNYKIPIKVELRHLNNYDGDLLSYITDEIIKFNKIAEKDRIVEKLLKDMNLIYIYQN